jgi:hypothetical protein
MKYQEPSPESSDPQAVISSGDATGPVVEGFGLCSVMFPPTRGRVVITTTGPELVASLSPKRSVPFGPPGCPSSKVLTRKYTSSIVLVLAVPQISQTRAKFEGRNGRSRGEEKRTGLKTRHYIRREHAGMPLLVLGVGIAKPPLARHAMHGGGIIAGFQVRRDALTQTLEVCGLGDLFFHRRTLVPQFEPSAAISDRISPLYLT